MTTPRGKYLKRRRLTRAQWRELHRRFRESPHVGAESRLLKRHARGMFGVDPLRQRAALQARYTTEGWHHYCLPRLLLGLPSAPTYMGDRRGATGPMRVAA